MKPIVFLGPSLPVPEAKRFLDAIYLPPVRQADLVSVIHHYRPNQVGIIDGFFGQDLSVWHKEILYALNAGIAVYGASSMGALRAAELDYFGMQGIGSVYAQYRDGLLLDDDEVALAHAPAELGYAKLSEPMVNVRATLGAAERMGIISKEENVRVCAAMKALHFTQRTVEHLVAFCPALNDFVLVNYQDVKRQDAIELLQTLAGRPVEASPQMPEPFVRTPLFETLYERDRQIEQGGIQVRLSSVVRHASLHAADFEGIRMRAIHRKLTVQFAAMIGLKISEAEVEQERKRFCVTRRLLTDDALSNWLRQNHLADTELTALLRELAICRAMREWWLSTSVRRDQKCKAILDELRLSGQYPGMAEAAAQREQACASEEEEFNCNLFAVADFKNLIEEHMRHSPFHVGMPIPQWAEENGFNSLEDLQMELLKSHHWRSSTTGLVTDLH